MKKTMVKIALRNGAQQTSGYEVGPFVVHESLDPKGEKIKGWWQVTHKATGYLLPAHINLRARKEAIELANKYLLIASQMGVSFEFNTPEEFQKIPWDTRRELAQAVMS